MVDSIGVKPLGVGMGGHSPQKGMVDDADNNPELEAYRRYMASLGQNPNMPPKGDSVNFSGSQMPQDLGAIPPEQIPPRKGPGLLGSIFVAGLGSAAGYFGYNYTKGGKELKELTKKYAENKDAIPEDIAKTMEKLKGKRTRFLTIGGGALALIYMTAAALSGAKAQQQALMQQQQAN